MKMQDNMDIKKNDIREALLDFQSMEHRLEYVATVRHIKFINNSKSTNLNSTWYAIDSCNSPIIWIAGGINMKLDYKELYSVVNSKVMVLVCIGKNNKNLKSAFKDHIPVIVEVNTMEEAVQCAYKLAKKRDTVLFSPCCPSPKTYKNEEERGCEYKKNVISL